jgi:hypothetical protein
MARASDENGGRNSPQTNTVMVGLGPTIHEFQSLMTAAILGASTPLISSIISKLVDGRAKRDHDG